MRRLASIVALGTTLALATLAGAQQVNTKPSKTKAPIQPSADAPHESSSRDTKIDLSPPKGDSMAHPNSEVPDVGEMHAYNPMRALKDVEVGDYYYRQGNYFAAISRYREALEFKPRDAVATFGLAQALEKNKDYQAARDSYNDYLQILPNGPQAAACHKAIERLDRRNASAR